MGRTTPFRGRPGCGLLIFRNPAEPTQNQPGSLDLSDRRHRLSDSVHQLAGRLGIDRAFSDNRSGREPQGTGMPSGLA